MESPYRRSFSEQLYRAKLAHRQQSEIYFWKTVQDLSSQFNIISNTKFNFLKSQFIANHLTKKDLVQNLLKHCVAGSSNT